ncbi:MAG: phosphodiester glycosidase family protein [Clostridia bacterium]|nr:phosphodiester glycosidase family protein [Clostridia bacterium]
MKKILSLCLCVCLMLTIALPAFAAELSIVTEEPLMQGVTYKRVQALFDNGWQDIHIIQADLKHPYLTFDVLSAEEGKSYRENTYASATRADALAAINADFFVTKSGETNRGSAIGLEIKDGTMLTSPAAYESMNALYQEKEDKTLFFSPFTFEFTITAPDGTTAPISVINKYDDLTGIVLYTTEWGKTTIGSAGNVLEVVVEDGIVTAKNMDIGPVEIPENGYVLTCDIGINTFLKDYFEVGSPVELTLATTPDYKDIETAVGGGGMLLVEGRIPESYSHTIGGTQPRSAVGVDKTGNILTLVAVDGRRSEATGMTMKQLGYLMADLGCYNAMNLDGGGSTLMTTRQSNGTHKVVNIPSDGSKRAVTNSIGLLTQNLEEPVVSAVRLKSDEKTVFAGTSLWLYLELLDQYGRVMDTAETKDVLYTVTNENGSFRGDYYYPATAGSVTITATAKGFTDTMTVEVLDTPHCLSFSKKTHTLKSGENSLLWLTGTDAGGRSAVIYPKDVQIKVLNPSVAKVDKNSVYALQKGATLITATLGDVAANTSVCVDGAEEIHVPKGVSLPDPQQKSVSVKENGFQFTVFGNTRTPKKLFDIYIMNGVVNAVKNESDMNFFVGNNVNKELLSDLGNALQPADGFSKFTKGTSTFITLKNAYGTMLYKAENSQWTKLKQAVDELSGDNLFVFLNDHNLSPSETEVTIFKRLMAEAAKKCNVYVFAGGFVNETVIEDGVRYITTAGVFPSIGVKPPATNISYLKYYLITVNGDEVTYETKGIVKNNS